MANNKFLKAVFTIFFISFFMATLSYGGEKNEVRSELREERVKITSDRLEADNKKGLVIFKGNVVARHKGAVIMSQVLTVTYDENKRIEKVNAKNDVRINDKNRVGTCEEADYFPKEKKIIMRGNPRVWREGNMVSGEIITIYLESDRMDVEGARAIIHSGEDIKKEGHLATASDEQ